MQELFAGVDFHFMWTDDGWYSWDRSLGEMTARSARDRRAQALQQQGYRVRRFRLGNQLVSRGGIGTRFPHIELETRVYGLEYSHGGRR